MHTKQVWGFKVEVPRAGRTNWPVELKRLAVRRILEAREAPSKIAVELGTTEPLVRKWCRKYASSRALPSRDVVPFAELRLEPEPEPAAAHAETCWDRCSLTVNDMRLEFPAAISAEHLARLIRTLRATS